MASQICNELIHEPWMLYFDASQIPHVGGIYVIGIRRPRLRAIQYLYLGQSNDVHRRLQDHKYGRQDIDAFIRRNYRRNEGRDLRVKWINEPRHQLTEGRYIRCMEQLLGYELEYNKNGGNN